MSKPTEEQIEQAKKLKQRIISAHKRSMSLDDRRGRLGESMYWILQNEFSGLMQKMGIGKMIHPL